MEPGTSLRWLSGLGSQGFGLINFFALTDESNFHE